MEKNVGQADLFARGLAGAALLAIGLIKKRSWLATLTGGGLLYTVYTRHCPINKALGVNTAGEQFVGNKPLVQESSEESFPASDAPAWTMGHS